MAGALLGLLVMAHLGAARAAAVSDNFDSGEEAISEVPDDRSDLPDTAPLGSLADAGRAGASPASAKPRHITPADNGLIKCMAGCVGQVGGSVVGLTSDETR
jgi:hypothetical protein